MSGLEITLALLAETDNLAATRVLIPALDKGQRAIQEGALRALLKRRHDPGHDELVRRWHTLSDRWKSIIAERPGRLTSAIRGALLSSDESMCKNGCDAAIFLREYDLMPALLHAEEGRLYSAGARIAESMITLAEALYDELASPRDYRNRRDPQVVRQSVLASLERSVARFSQHRCREVLEAFLLLANRDNLTLRKILQNLYDPGYRAIIETLTGSPGPGVMRLLLNYLEDPQPPPSALNVVAYRRDVPFLRRLLRKLGGELTSPVTDNLRRMERITWFDADSLVLQTLNDQEQATAVRLLAASGLSRQDIFEMLRRVLKQGRPGGRRQAALALDVFRSDEANELALETLHDEDPQVQANVLVQLRERGVAGALDMLMDMLDSPHEVVQEAVQQSLVDFSFARYVGAFDKLDEETQRKSGFLVKKADPTTLSSLHTELESPSRTRRLRGLKIAVALDQVAESETQILAIMEDEDYLLRTSAAQALETCRSPTARRALTAALEDPHVAVRDAADQALRSVDCPDDPRTAFTAASSGPASSSPVRSTAARDSRS